MLESSEWMQRAVNWANNNNFSSELKEEVQILLSKKDETELKDRFYKHLEFGTGGMRGIIGAGTNRINIYTVRRITKAISLTLKEKNPGKALSAVVCYDSRKYSPEFAQEVCAIFLQEGIKTYLFSRLNPVALLSFAVRELQADAGVMITASHNPIQYNGYKAYGATGAQVTPPIDGSIEKQYLSLDYLDPLEAAKSSPIYLGEEFEKKYLERIRTTAFNLDLVERFAGELKIVYTPIHGTGLIPVTAALKDWGFTHVFVNEAQQTPDSRFPTVTSPNPEDPKALRLAVEQMLDIDADVAFGTDPDTDRLGVVINLHKNKEVYYLNGNEIGAVLLYYFLEESKRKNLLTKESLVVKSIVTSTIQDKMCAKYDVSCLTTLTGFKWMCLEMDRFFQKNPKAKFLFASEESFGVLTHPFCRDKDAVAGIAHFCEMLLWLKFVKKMSLLELLDHLHQEFGYHKEGLITKDYPGPEGSSQMMQVMNSLREMDVSTLNEKLRSTLHLSGEKILQRQDYLKPEKDSSLPPTNCLGFTFESGHHIYLRPSGTEPKMKIYFLLRFDYEQKKTKEGQENIFNIEKGLHELFQSFVRA